MLHHILLDGVDANGNPWPPPMPAEYCEDMGAQGGRQDDNKKLLQQVPIRGIDPLAMDGHAAVGTAGKAAPTLFCGVYTMAENHASNVRVMRETWAPHCNGFVAFSTASDPRIPALQIQHEGP
jgi:glycoprotein-N-acetylgalactosamine 3-beta-galactosyltransferase